MKNKYIITTALLLLTSPFLKANSFDVLKEKVVFWTGKGSDSSLMVVSFSSTDFDSSLVWGVLHNGGITVASQLDTIAKYDVNFEWESAGSFLDFVKFAHHQGRNATEDFYWGMYTFDSVLNEWQYNNGLSQVVSHRSVQGLSFTDFNPELKPGSPIPALPPQLLSINDWEQKGLKWFGEGDKKALLIVDFLQSIPRSYVFGVRFQNEATGLDLLQAIAKEDTLFAFEGQAFLQDLVYGADSGMFASPNYWGTWSATNFGDWIMNVGLSTPVLDGHFFACTYTDFAPPLRPSTNLLRVSAPAKDPTLVKQWSKNVIEAFPNPFSTSFSVLLESPSEVIITDCRGVLLYQTRNESGRLSLGEDWATGLYFLQIQSASGVQQIKMIKCP